MLDTLFGFVVLAGLATLAFGAGLVGWYAYRFWEYCRQRTQDKDNPPPDVG